MSLKMNPADEDDAGEFAALRSFDAIAAYLFKKHGPDSVRANFHWVGGFTSEALTEAAEALEQRGLDQVAKVMHDLAAEYPSGIDLNPYDPKDRCNWLVWNQSWLSRQQMRTQRKLQEAKQARS
jgi:hypothetical protein